MIDKAFEVFCKTAYRFYCPLTVVGQENLPNEPFILCSNHASHMDSTALMAASGLPFNRFGMLAAKDYFFVGKRKHLVSPIMNLIPIDRKSSRQSILQNLQACRDFLAMGGRNLIVYPEGTRTLDGNLQSFKKGAALMAVELGLPIVPAYIAGTFNAMPKKSLMFKPLPIAVYFGEPIDTQAYSLEKNETLRNNAIYSGVTQELERRVWELQKAAQR